MENRKLTLKPAGVFLLLLNGNIVRNDVGQLSIEATLLQITVKESLKLLIKVSISRATVKALAVPVLLSSLSLSKIGLVELRNLVDLKDAV
jgi:hypothetical protein